MSDENFFRAQKVEIELRGRCLRFSANVEANLTRDLLLLNEQKFLKTNIESPLNFKELMFHKKIELLEVFLKDLHPDLFISNNHLFSALYGFKDIRNKMAHSFFVWNESDLEYVTIWEIEKDADRIWRHIPVRYSVISLENLLRKSMIEITDELNALSRTIIERLRPEMPYLFDQISNE